MKALILTCNTGQGHNSVSASLAGVFGKKGIECETTDALAFISEWASKTICDWHVRLYRYFPKTSGNSYSFIEQHPELFNTGSPIHRLLDLGIDKLYAKISSGGFDTVICPHVISALMATDLEKQYPDVKLRTCFIATDYTCYPMTEESDLDLYFVPSGELIPAYENIGINKEKIRPIDGIPVREEFFAGIDKSEAKRRLGIPENYLHTLMMFGSMGCGNIPKLAGLIDEKMPENAVLTVVCGTNETVYKKLEKQFEGSERVRVEGFVKNVPELMDSADLFITKPGGLSTAEAAVKRLPMLLDNAVSGCEQYNLDYFCGSGAAVTAKGEEEIASVCAELLRDPETLERMKEKLPERKNSAEQAIEILLGETKEAKAPPEIENDFRYWRERIGLEQNELARMMAIPPRTLKSWESGKTSPPEYVKRLLISELKRISRNKK